MGVVIPLVIASLLLGFVLFVRYYANGGLYRRYCTHIKTSLKGKTVLITGKLDTIGNIHLLFLITQYIDSAYIYD